MNTSNEPAIVHFEAHLPVTGRLTKSLALRLYEAEILLPAFRAVSPGAQALIAELAGQTDARQQRTRPRGEKRLQKLRDTVDAITGAILRSHLRRGCMVFRSRSRGAYSARLPYAEAIFVLDQMAAMGLLGHHSGYRFNAQTFGAEEEWGGIASRYEASDRLVELAARHGVTADTVKADFAPAFPRKAEAIKQPVELRQFKEHGGKPIKILRSDIAHRELSQDVLTANRLLAGVLWSANCQPPALRRVFRSNWDYSGRWLVVGDAPIQQMAPEDRLEILMNGAPVCEVDATGSQISILAALAGVVEIGGDPYQVGPLAAFDRAVVKDATTFTLGSGKLRTKWPAETEHGLPISVITAALLTAHPYLKNMTKLLAVPSGHVSVRLQNIEAQCLTAAMRLLWAAAIPCVPIHDGLLAPAVHAAAAEAALREGYRSVAGAVIRTKLTMSALPEAA